MKNAILLLGILGLLSACDNGPGSKEFGRMMEANVALVEKAHEGDPGALDRLIVCLRDADYYDSQQQEIYYWLIRKDNFTKEDLSQAILEQEKNLKGDDKRLVENWLTFRPDLPMLPPVTKIDCRVKSG